MKQKEAASSDAKAAEALLPAEFQELMVFKCYLLQQVFNSDEIEFFLRCQKGATFQQKREYIDWSYDNKSQFHPLSEY